MESSKLASILKTHTKIAETMIRKQGDIAPMVVGYRRKMLVPIVVKGDRETLKATIELVKEDADWIVVMNTGWMRKVKKEEIEEILKHYKWGRIANDPQREEILIVQVSLRDGTKDAIVERIIRGENDIRFERIRDIGSEAKIDGYLAL